MGSVDMRIVAFLFPVVFLAGYLIYRLNAPDVVFIPSPLNLLTLFVAVWLSLTIRNGYARGVCLFWAIWFVLGSISLFAQNQLYTGLNYKFPPDAPNQFYLSCVLAGTAAIKLMEVTLAAVAPTKLSPLNRGSNPVAWGFLLLFPLLYGASIVAATGTIPMFSGQNVSAEMYEVSYGPLHAFGIFVTVACIALWMKSDSAQSFASRPPVKYGTIALLAFMLVVAVFDGRRVLAIFALLGILLYSTAQSGRPGRWLQMGAFAVLTLVGYVVAAAVRAGSTAGDAFDSIWEPLSTVGVEYRDFAYSFARLSPVQVRSAGYDWFGSTIATLTPTPIVTAFGFDKSALVQADSARTLMQFFDVKLGIRVGLPGELWLAYGWWAVAVFTLFALVVYATAWLAMRTNHFIYRAILLTLLALGAASVLGQSTVTFGLLLPLIYLSLLVRLIEFVVRPPRQARRSPPSREVPVAR